MHRGGARPLRLIFKDAQSIVARRRGLPLATISPACLKLILPQAVLPKIKVEMTGFIPRKLWRLTITKGRRSYRRRSRQSVAPSSCSARQAWARPACSRSSPSNQPRMVHRPATHHRRDPRTLTRRRRRLSHRWTRRGCGAREGGRGRSRAAKARRPRIPRFDFRAASPIGRERDPVAAITEQYAVSPNSCTRALQRR